MSQISNNFDYFANDLGLNLNNYAINYDFKRNRNIIQAARLTGNTPGNPDSDFFGYSTSLNSAGNVLSVGAQFADTNGISSAGAVYIFTGNGNSWAQAARLTGNTLGLGNPASNFFGSSTSLNSAGNVLSVGAYLADTNGISSAGAVYIFTGNGNSWAQAARLTGNTLGLGNPAGDYFGSSTSLNSAGNVLSVGAYLADTTGVAAGAVYIFTGNGNSWAQAARLTGNTPGNPASDFFGISTSLNSAGNVLSVGAYLADTDGVAAGAVYVFTGNGNSWAQAARLTGNTPGNPASNFFGSSTSLNSAGNVLSVGAYLADTNGISSAGAVYIFTGNGNSWAQAARLTGNTLGLGNPGNDHFGYSTSLNSAGNVLSVGAFFADTNGISSAGAVYVFTGNGNSWAQAARLTGNTLGLGNPDSDYFGYSTSLNSAGNVLSVGAQFADTNGISNAGAVYIFDTNSYIKNLSVFSGFYSGEIKNDQAINLLQNNEIIEFSGSNYLEVKNATGLKNDYFTIYCAYERSSGEEAVLFSSLHSIDNINYSGFNFGITRYNNYYYEYYDLADGPKVYISSKKADTKGIVALTKNVTTININNYDATEEIFEFESFETVSDTDKQNKFLIGFGDTYPFFSGKNFIGKINSLIYLNESLNSTYLNDAADGFIYDINKNITLENIEEIYSFTGFEGNITGGFFDTTSGNLLNCLNNYSFYDYPGFVSGVIFGSITGGIHTATGYFTGFIAQTFNYTKDVERFFSNIVITGTNTGYELFISGTGYTGYVNINAGEIVNICGTGSPIYFISGLGNETLSGLVVTGVDQLTGLVTGIQLLKNQSFLETINFPFSGNINSLFNSFVNTGNYTYKFTLENNGTYITKNEQIKFSNTYLTGVEISKTTNLLINKFTTKDKNINYLNSIGVDEVVFNKKLDSEDVIEVYAFDFDQDYSPIINENEKINTTNNTFRIFDNKNISAIHNNGLLEVNKIEIPSNFNYFIDSIDRISGNYDLDDLVLIDFIKTGFSGYYYDGTGYMLYPDHKDFLYSYGKKLISGIDYFQSGDNKTYNITGLIIKSPSQLARLTGNTPGNPDGDNFGHSTSLNSAGNVLSVGAYSADTNGVSNAGAVYIFTGNGNSWAQAARLTGNTLGLGNPSNDYFGYSTSLNSAGNVLSVGAFFADTNGVSNAGAVYIFTGNGNSWAQAARLTGNTLGLGNPDSDYFGYSTSLNSAGNVLSVGAYFADTNGVSNAGAVYIFTGNGNSWAQAARLTGNTPGNPVSDFFGYSTSLNSAGNVLSVGAYLADTDGVAAGAVYVFTGNGNSWAQAARLTGNTPGNPASNFFGSSTSLNSAGNVLSVGAYLADTNGISSAGAVYVFTGNGNSWAQAARLTGNTLGLGNPDNDFFGYSTSLNSAGNVLSVGAYLADTTGVAAGAVYLFDTNSYKKEKEKTVDGYIYGYNSILDYKLISGNTYTLNLPKKYSRDSISVYLNGIKQNPITDYIEKSLFDKIFDPVFIENLSKNIYNTNDALDVNK
jgi:hypothetical protein